MARHFNTAGPNNPAKHYCIDPFERINWTEIQQLIDDEKYFVMHAPRQSGKTTLLQAIVERINDSGRYVAMRFSVQSAQAALYDLDKGNQIIARQLLRGAQFSLPQSFIVTHGQTIMEKEKEPGVLLNKLLTEWAANSEKPIVLLIDEIDALIGETLVSVLSQLRDGYIARPDPFPQSIVLCGVRDVRDYRIQMSNGTFVTGSSPFNIKTKSLTIGNFSESEVRALYVQHTAETRQIFEESIFPKVMALTGGQPWLVNALANELTQEMPELKDRSRSIGLEEVDEAKEHLILRRDTHIDQLVDKLKEERVRRVIEPILNGSAWGKSVSEDDRQYAVDLGLIVVERSEGIRIANDIYREVIPRALTSIIEDNFTAQVPKAAFLFPDGRLNFQKLLSDFQQFYQENASVWKEKTVYEEAAPQLLLQSWLHRMVNGGGRIEREYALGRGRADLFVRFFYQENGERKEQRFLVEMKIKHGSLESTIEKGLEQTAGYAEMCNPEESHLIVIDPPVGAKRRRKIKIFTEERIFEGRRIKVWGM